MNLSSITAALRRLPRTTSWLIAACVLLSAVAVISPVQLPVILYKGALVSLAAVLGYWLDRSLFPYARPDGYLVSDWRDDVNAPNHVPSGRVDYPVVSGYHWIFAAALLRRAVVVGAAMAGVALGM